jgi:predicted ATPase
VRELYQPITERRGYFISGKFDQYQRNMPYAGMVAAFAGLVRQLLGGSEAELRGWRDRIRSAVGRNGRVISEVLPDVERIIGEQPEVPRLGATESQNRFNYVFQKFVRVFCRPEHPLTLFLDDLQWADMASLNLLRLLLTDRQIHHLLVLGAYRSNEVNHSHPLTLALEGLQQEGISPQTVTLGPLAAIHVGQLLSDTLHQPVEEITDLIALVMQKTTGNPFFINQFLKTLHSQNLLSFDGESGCWRWDIEQINAVGFTDNVVALMVGSLKQLPKSTQQVLQWAACIGAEFDLKTLGMIAGQAVDPLLTDLAIANQHGLLMPLPDGEGSWPCSRYRFTHDQVQQAAYELINPDQRQKLHLQIGRLLWQKSAQSDLPDHLFAVTDHLNLGLLGSDQRITLDGSEGERIAELNLQAGIKAKFSLAYDSALTYLQAGLTLLGQHPWQEHYPLTLAFHEEAAEAAYLSGNSTQMESYIDQALTQVTTPLERVRSYDIKIQALASQGNLQGAIEVGLAILHDLGTDLPLHPTAAEGQTAMQQLNDLLANWSTDDLLRLPEMTDPIALASVKTLARVAAAAYISAPGLLPLVLLKIFERSLQYGNTPASCIGYLGYAVLLSGRFGEIERGTSLVI